MPRRIILSITLSIGVGLSIVAASNVNRWEESNRQIRFQWQVENLKTTLQRNLNRYTDLLAFLEDYYAVEQSPLNRPTFGNLVKRSLQTYPGIQALEWAPLVRLADRSRYEQMVRSEGYPSFKITKLDRSGRLVKADQSPYYIPVTYVEPWTENESALGYDLYSDTTRSIAITQARETGKITATGRIRLVQEKRNQFGFLVFQPIYQQPLKQPTPRRRREQFIGVLVGVFRVSDVIEESLQGLQSEIDFTIYEEASSPSEQFLGRYDATQKRVNTVEASFSLNRRQLSLCPSISACSQRVSVGQRQWLIVFSPSANYPLENQYGAIATFVIGLLLTSGLVIFLHQVDRELEQAQELSDLRVRFFSMASHELRTPLSTILVSSEFLQLNYDQLTEEQKQNNIQRISLVAKQMSQQLADLLTLTRAEAGKLEFQPELLELEPFCQKVVEEMQIGITQKIQYKDSEQVTKAFLDKKLLRSLLSNLLSNAAKYSSKDTSIEVILDCNGTTAILQVKDHGIGILDEERSRICEVFYRGSNVGETTGTGLGLAIVKICVELHRGSWQLDSEPSQGTTVTVKLPLE